jgi:hypothetical protein
LWQTSIPKMKEDIRGRAARSRSGTADAGDFKRWPHLTDRNFHRLPSETRCSRSNRAKPRLVMLSLSMTAVGA